MKYTHTNGEIISAWKEKYALPWMQPISHEEYLRAAKGEALMTLTPLRRVPFSWYGGCAGKQVLGLAAGGGQQMALLSAAKEALDAGQIQSIRLSTRPDAIDETVLHRLHDYGVETIELGAQSMDDEVLRASNRGHTAGDVFRASAMVKEAGFRLILQMMTGLPGDSPGRCVETARRIIKCRPDGVRIYPTVIVKDTELYERWLAGEYREHTVEDAVRICARIVPLFERAGIPVIRLGLNPTEELSGGAAVAGAYHPALGELVKSRILYNRAETLLEGIKPGSKVILEVHPSQLSQMTGQHRQNITELTERFSLAELKVRSGAEEKDEIRVIVADGNSTK